VLEEGPKSGRQDVGKECKTCIHAKWEGCPSGVLSSVRHRMTDALKEKRVAAGQFCQLTHDVARRSGEVSKKGPRDQKKNTVPSR